MTMQESSSVGSSDEADELYHVNNRSGSTDELITTVKIEGKSMNIEIDTGAKKSIISNNNNVWCLFRA